MKVSNWWYAFHALGDTDQCTVKSLCDKNWGHLIFTLEWGFPILLFLFCVFYVIVMVGMLSFEANNILPFCSIHASISLTLAVPNRKLRFKICIMVCLNHKLSTTMEDNLKRPMSNCFQNVPTVLPRLFKWQSLWKLFFFLFFLVSETSAISPGSFLLTSCLDNLASFYWQYGLLSLLIGSMLFYPVLFKIMEVVFVSWKFQIIKIAE